MRHINEIIIHCTATRPHLDITAKDVTAWHKAIGFETIGYHYLVRLDGTVEEGRPLTRIGAHCRGHNLNSIGVCYVGGVGEDNNPSDTRTAAQRWALRKLLWKLKEQFPLAKIRGHRDFANKACPSFDATTEYGDISDYQPGATSAA